MNFALLIRSKAVLALRDWSLALVAAHRPAPIVLHTTVPTGIRLAVPAPATVHCARSVARPLRVVRVVESGQARTSDIGRIVISGRMADVCAELDRMVAREAAQSRVLGRSMAAAF